MRFLSSVLPPSILVAATLGLGVACGSDPKPAPATPFAVGPSGGELWAPEEKSEPTPTPTAVETAAPPIATTASVSASASSSAKKPAASTSAKPTPKASASSK